MATTTSKLSNVISGSAGEYIAANEQAGRSLEKFVAQNNRASNQIAAASRGGHGGGAYGALNEMLGRQSSFGHMMKLLHGGGALIGLKMAASEVAHMAEAAEKYQEALAKGPAAVEAAKRQMAESIPIIGDLVKAIGSVQSAFNGEARIRAEIEQQNAQLKETIELRKRINEILRESAKHTVDLELQASRAEALAGAMSPAERKYLQARYSEADARVELERKTAEQIDKIKSAYDEKRERLAKESLGNQALLNESMASEFLRHQLGVNVPAFLGGPNTDEFDKANRRITSDYHQLEAQQGTAIARVQADAQRATEALDRIQEAARKQEAHDLMREAEHQSHIQTPALERRFVAGFVAPQVTAAQRMEALQKSMLAMEERTARATEEMSKAKPNVYTVGQ